MRWQLQKSTELKRLVRARHGKQCYWSRTSQQPRARPSACGRAMGDRNLDLWVSDQLYALLGAGASMPHRLTAEEPFCVLAAREVILHCELCFCSVCAAVSSACLHRAIGGCCRHICEGVGAEGNLSVRAGEPAPGPGALSVTYSVTYLLRELSGAGQRCSSLLHSASRSVTCHEQMLKCRAAIAALDNTAGLGARGMEWCACSCIHSPLTCSRRSTV